MNLKPSSGLLRRLLALVVVPSILIGVSIPRLAFAQGTDYPNKNITLVVPYAAGGQTDLMGRLLAERLAVVLEKAVVVENRAGATGSIAARLVARSKPDGYTLLFGSGGPMSINPVLHKRIFNFCRFIRALKKAGIYLFWLEIRSERCVEFFCRTLGAACK